MKSRILLLFFLVSSGLYAQNNQIDRLYSIKTVVVDSIENYPVEMAIASLYSKEGKLMKGVAADSKGLLVLNNISSSSYDLMITFMGYDTVRISIPQSRFNKADLVLDTVKLQIADIMLSTITIVAEPPELVIREDTLEYNAAAFKVAEGAVVEDLIKRLPGMEVDTDGNIKKPDGKQVQRVFVDGKEFFGNDPKMATKNLTANIVDKVQVIEKKSDMAILTGIDDGEEETIINITIKKGMKQGWMGNVRSGLGALTNENTDNAPRYRENLMVNRFLENDQFTFIANANNVNNQGSSDGGNNARSGRGSSGRSGITSSNTFGVNTAKIINDKLKFGGNVRYNYSDSYAENDRFRQNLLKDSVSYRKSLSTDRDYSNNFTFDGRLEYEMDSSTMIILNPHISYNYSKSNSASHQITMAGDIDSSKVNESNSSDRLQSDGFNSRLSLNVSRKLSAKGRRLSLNASYGLNKSTGTGDNNSENIFYRNPGRNKVYDQITKSNQDRYSYSASVNYVEPVGTNNYLNFSYDVSINNTKNRKETLDYDENTGDYTSVDPDFNISSDSRNINQNFRANFRSVRQNYTYNVGLRMAPTKTTGKTFIQDWYSEGNDSIVNPERGRTATNYAPQLDFTYKFSNTRELRKNLRLRYNGSSSLPSVAQLDPTPNNTNPLHIRSGNPDLLSAFTHNISMNYDFNNRESQKVFTVNLNHRIIQNQIISYTEYEEGTGVQSSSPINENGTWRLNGNIYFAKPFDRAKRLRFSTRTGFGYDNNIGYAIVKKQSERNISKTQNLSQELNLSYSNDLFYGQIRGRLNYSKTSNTVSTNQNGMETFNYMLSYNTTLTLPYSWSVTSDINYTANRGLSTGYNLNETIWNAEVSKQFLRQNRGTISLQVTDILQQKLSVRRNITANYIDDIRNNAMTGYLMVSFTYRFNNIGGRGRQRSNNRQEFNGGEDMGGERSYRGSGGQGGFGGERDGGSQGMD